VLAWTFTSFGPGREGNYIRREGRVGWLKVLGLNSNFPHVFTLPEYISRYLGVSIV